MSRLCEHRWISHKSLSDCRRTLAKPGKGSLAKRVCGVVVVGPLIFRALGIVMLLASCFLFWSVLLTWTLLDWRYTAVGLLLYVGSGLVGFCLTVRWLP